jgi:glycosyltransferase involved in cell wall biosynthesis
MRIAIVNSNRNVMGGVEVYLRQLIPALLAQNHELSFWYEVESNEEREVVLLPEGVASWSVAALGSTHALNSLAEWQPDVIYAHGLRAPALEAEVQKIGPAVFYAHSYYGGCVSGAKTFRKPSVKPCDRRFGWQCLLHYYPRRCGGLNPQTMLREYKRQAARLALLRDYRAILVASSHMAHEYEKYDLNDRVRIVRLPIPPVEGQVSSISRREVDAGWRLLFMGRMEFLKGGATFLEALPVAMRELGKPLSIIFAGSGPSRDEWRSLASRIASTNPGLDFKFIGWMNAEQRDAVMSSSDLLVVPSLWPEPFGLVGLEAASYGIPAVAFDVGGISEWLRNGINGVLALGNPPTSMDLASAIVSCLNDTDFYLKLCQGARSQAQLFNMEAHLTELLPVLQGAMALTHSIN